MPTIPVYADLDMQSTSRLTNLLDPTVAQHAATKAYVDATVEGLNWKDSARVASTANITITAPGATIDGITMATNDRMLLKNQTNGQDNGIYIWNGAASTATRSLDMNVAAEVEAAVVYIEEGTVNDDTTWRQTTPNVTLGTTVLVWSAFGTAAPAASEGTAGIAELATQAETNTGTDDLRIVTPLKLKTQNFLVQKSTQTFGDGAATSFDLTHGLAADKILDVTVFETGGTFREVMCEIQHLSTTQVRVLASPAPASGALTLVVLSTDN